VLGDPDDGVEVFPQNDRKLRRGELRGRAMCPRSGSRWQDGERLPAYHKPGDTTDFVIQTAGGAGEVRGRLR